MALPTAAYSPADGICNVGSFPDSPGSSAAFRLQFQTLYDQARDFVNALKAALESTAGGASGAENIGSKAVGAIPAGSIYSQLAALKAIADSAVAASLIPGCINNANLFAAGVVDNTALGALAVTAAKLAADAVETLKIKDENVTAAKLATDSVETLKIKNENVTAAKLAADAVETVKIKDANVTLTKLGADVPQIYNGADDTSMPDAAGLAEGSLYWWPAA